MDEKKIDFNINDYVYVKLTDKGREVVAHKDVASLYKEDENGISQWQFWELMKMFGPYIHLGGPTYFNTNIQIEVPEDKGSSDA